MVMNNAQQLIDDPEVQTAIYSCTLQMQHLEETFVLSAAKGR